MKKKGHFHMEKQAQRPRMGDHEHKPMGPSSVFPDQVVHRTVYAVHLERMTA